MQVEIVIDEKQLDPKVIILTDKMTDEIENMLKKLSESRPLIISGFKDDLLEILDPQKIIRAYSSNQKVYAVTQKDEYVVRLRLYEL